MNKKTIALLASTALVLPVTAVLLGRALAAWQLRQDVTRLFAQAPDVTPQVYEEAQLRELPPPVQRYFRRVLRPGQPYRRGVRLRHTGQFKPDLRKDWVAIEGEQYLRADPPGFIWQGRTRQFTARDEYVDGRGHLRVLLLGALPLLHGQGPRYDQGELLRWLGESVWLPTSLLPSAHLRWTSLDEHSARLTLQHQGQMVSYRVRFNEQDELTELETQRYQGDARLLTWQGRATHYHDWHGQWVPTVLEGSWVQDDGQRQPYAHFVVQALDYDPPGRFPCQTLIRPATTSAAADAGPPA